MSVGFSIYVVYTISFFLHIPARVPFLGTVRFDLLLILLILFAIPFDRSARIQSVIDGPGKPLLVLFLYIVVSLPFVRWPGSAIHTGLPALIKAILFYI